MMVTDEQIQRFEGFLKHDPNNLRLLFDLAQKYYAVGRLDDANALIERCISLSPEQVQFRHFQGSIFLAMNRGDLAIQSYEWLLEKGIDDDVTRYNLAYALFKEQQYDGAISLLEKVSAPQVATLAPTLLGRALHHTGNLQKAISVLQSFLLLQPDHTEAKGLLSLIYLDAGDNEHAKLYAESAAVSDPPFCEAYITLASLAVESQIARDALSASQKAIEKHAKSGRARLCMGQAHMLDMNISDAAESFTLAVQYMPQHIGSWHALGWCLLLLNDVEQAREQFEQALRLDRNFGESHGGLAVVQVIQNELEEAERSIKRALRLNPMSFSALYAQSLLDEKKGNQSAAEKQMKDIFDAELAGGQNLKQLLATFAKNNDINKPR